MAKAKVCDVFIAHAYEDAAQAARIASRFRAEGLAAVTHAELSSPLSSASDVGEAVWNALMESLALVLVLSTAGLSPTMTVELGAAWGANKPVYGIIDDPLAKYEGLVKSKVKLYPKESIPDVIHAIKAADREFSDQDRDVLKRLYSQASVTVDRLAAGSTGLEVLAEAFALETGRRVDGDRLLSELFRMRKQGKLPRRRRAAGRTPA
jgi:hypothetical protein